MQRHRVVPVAVLILFPSRPTPLKSQPGGRGVTVVVLQTESTELETSQQESLRHKMTGHAGQDCRFGARLHEDHHVAGHHGQVEASIKIKHAQIFLNPTQPGRL